MSEVTMIVRSEYAEVVLVDDDEIVVLDLASGMYYGISGAAKELWLILSSSGSVTADSVVDRWRTEFSQSAEELRRLFDQAVDVLRERGLVRVVSHKEVHN